MTKGNSRDLKKIHFSTEFADTEAQVKAGYNDDDLGICLANIHISQGNKFSYLQNRSLLLWMVLQSYESLTTLGLLACVSRFYFHISGGRFFSFTLCVSCFSDKGNWYFPHTFFFVSITLPLPSPFDSTVMKKHLFLRFRYHCYLHKIK